MIEKLYINEEVSVLVTFKLQHHQVTSKMRTTVFLVLLAVFLSISAAAIVNLEPSGTTEGKPFSLPCQLESRFQHQIVSH